jgi:hypothetical protein
MATAAVQPTVLSRSQEHTERVVYAIFMIVAPLILLVATIVHPRHGIGATDGADYYGAAHVGYFLTGTTLIVAVIGLTQLVRRTHPKAAFWGLVLSGMGFVGWGAIDGMDFMTFNAGQNKTLDTNTMQAYINAALANNWVLIPVFGVFALLIVGLVVICVGLHRAGIVTFFLALLLPIGVGGVISFLDYPPLEIAAGLCVCASVIPVGVRQLRGPRVPDNATSAQPATG